MDVNLQHLNSIMKPAQTNLSKGTSAEAQQSFKSWLNDSIKNVNAAQVESASMTERLVRGENVELHDVMITAQKASISLQTTVEVRNKAIEAYQEIMRMQV